VPIIEQDAVGNLDAVVADYLGDAADWDVSPAPTVTVQTLLGVAQAGFPSTTIVHDGLGLYHYVWNVPIGQTIATYNVHFIGYVGGALWDGWDTVEVVAAGTAPTTGLCTLADARQITHLDNPTNTADDADLLVLIDRVTDLIHTMIDRYFLQDDAATYTFDGQWGNSYSYGNAYGGQGPSNRFYRLLIPRGIRAITTLKLRLGGTGSTQITVPSTAYVIRPAEQDRDPGEPGRWIEFTYPPLYTFSIPGSDVIEVVGDFGYDSVPPWIQKIALNTVARAWRARSSGMGEALGGEPGAGYIHWAMSKDDEDMLQSHYSEWPLVR
jgi:hypothetical protein